MATEGKAVTIAEAATALGVQPQRISQMLASGALRGPQIPAGTRAPAGAPRVYGESLQDEVARREEGRLSRPGRRVRDLEKAVAALSDDVNRLTQSITDRERAARGAAVEMKAAMDLLHEQLLAQIAENEALALRSAQQQVQLESARRRAAATEASRAALDAALGTLLGPAGPHEIGR